MPFRCDILRLCIRVYWKVPLSFCPTPNESSLMNWSEILEKYPNTEERRNFMIMLYRVESQCYCVWFVIWCMGVKSYVLMVVVGTMSTSVVFYNYCLKTLRRKDRWSFMPTSCITPKYLTTIVRELSGKSVSKWIHGIVIREACYKLIHGVESVQQISYDLNFPNQSFFGKYFKSYVGCSPSEYRLQNLNSICDWYFCLHFIYMCIKIY